MDLTPLYVIGAATVRSAAGWIENALEDGKISSFEWGQLGATIFRVGVLGTAAAYGFNLSGLEAAGTAIVADFIIKAIAKFKKK